MFYWVLQKFYISLSLSLSLSVSLTRPLCGASSEAATVLHMKTIENHSCEVCHWWSQAPWQISVMQWVSQSKIKWTMQNMSNHQAGHKMHCDRFSPGWSFSIKLLFLQRYCLQRTMFGKAEWYTILRSTPQNPWLSKDQRENGDKTTLWFHIICIMFVAQGSSSQNEAHTVTQSRSFRETETTN